MRCLKNLLSILSAYFFWDQFELRGIYPIEDGVHGPKVVGSDRIFDYPF